MFQIIFQKELRSILQSPKFVASFAVCSILILLSVFAGILEYQDSVESHAAVVSMNLEEASSQASWDRIQNRVYREPDPLQVFVSGVHFDVGRRSVITTTNRGSVQGSVYSEQPIYAVFRFLDFSFVSLIVFSLMAILFTYDSVSGEREDGTLKLVFSNGISKATYLLAKATGVISAMVIPMLIPLLIALLLVVVMGVPLTGTDWIRVLSIIGVSLLYLMCFVCIGLFVSSLTRYANVSFLVLLVIWVSVVLVVPRLSVLVASQFVHVPTVAEVESQRQGFLRNEQNKNGEALRERWAVRNQLTAENGYEYMAENQDKWLQEDDSLSILSTARVDEFRRNLDQDVNNRKQNQMRLAMGISRISPASAFQYAVMTAAETDVEMKSRFESDLDLYRTSYTDYVKEQGGSIGGMQATRIVIGSGSGATSGFSMNQLQNEQSIDVSGMPVFEASDRPTTTLIAAILPDIAILLIASLVAFSGAFFAFIRYDVR